jgi:hypothetical protein
MMMKKTIVVLIAIALSACSSIKSIESPNQGTETVDGLTYFMPKKDFLVMITTTGGLVTKVVLGTTPSYPDLSKQYVLRYTRNWIGKNTLDVGVNEAGLLTSTNSTTVSNVADLFKALATTAGYVGALGLRTAGIEGAPCAANGDHSFVFKEPREYPAAACGMTINIKQIADSVSVVPHSKKANEEYSGIFYRQNIPYLVTAVGNGLNVASVVFSPSESKIHFLPVSKTMLSNNQADFGFVEGIPTKYKQETESELLVLFKLPADVIGAYFTGIGNVFDSFKSKDTKEAEALAESLKLELEKKKYDACISAIRAGDDELMKKLGCQ